MQTGETNSPARRKDLLRQHIQRSQRGQSLVEFALSISVLVLVFSGAVDLGRMFFTRINIDSMIGEGLHWAAAYPGCLKYGVDTNATASSNVDRRCWQTNSIKGRMDQENNMLGTSQWVTTDLVFDPQPGCTTRCSVTLDQLQPGDTIKLSTTYRITLITPLMRALFGDTMDLTVEAKEVVRGGSSDIPDTEGGTLTHPSTGGTIVDPISNPKQGNNTMPNLICNQGQATITWQGVPGAAGYRVYNVNTGTTPHTLGSLITSVANPGGFNSNTYGSTQTYTATVKADMTSPKTVTQIAVKSFVVYGTYDPNVATTYAESSVFYIYNISCNAVHPSDPNNAPAPLTPVSALCRHDGSGLDFTWDMRTPVDTAVTGYKANRIAPAGALTLTASPIDGTARAGTYSFTAAADWTANSAYNIQAVDSTNTLIGSPSDNSAAITCTYASTITIDIIDNNSTAGNLYTPGAPMTYTIRMTNTDTSGNAALGLTLTSNVSGFTGGAGSLSWQCVSLTATNGAHCNGSTSGTATPGTPFTTNLYLPAGSYLEMTIAGTAPTGAFAAQVSATASLAVPTLCGANCTINGTNTVSAAPDIDNPNLNTNLSITNDDGRTTYQAGDSISYIIKVKNTGAYGATAVSVTDSFTGPFTPTGWTCAVSLAGTGAPITACSAPSFAGSTPLNDIVNIASGGELTYTVTGTAGTGGATITNTAVYSHALAVPSSGNASDNPSDTYQAAANLSVTYVDASGNPTTPSNMGSPTTYTVGSAQTYRIKVANTGADTITANFSNDGAGLGAPSNQWSCSVTSGTATCPSGSNPGPAAGIPSNQSFTINSGGALTFVVTGTVQAAAPNPLVNTSTITNPSVTNNGASSATASNDKTGSPAADLQITAGTVPSSYFPNDTLTYTIRVKNTGTSSAGSPTNTFAVAWDSSQFSTPSGGTCVVISGGATCPAASMTFTTNTGTSGTFNLPFTSGVTSEVAFTFTLRAIVSTGTLRVTATATGVAITDSGSPNTQNFDVSTISGAADLELVSMTSSGGGVSVVSPATPSTYGNYTPSSSQTYTMVVRNNGPKNLTNATFGLTYPTALTGVTWTCASSGGGTCASGTSGSGGATSLTSNVTLNSGQSVTFTATGTVAPGTTGDFTATASVAAPSFCTSTCDATTNNSRVVTDKYKVDLQVYRVQSSTGGDTLSSTTGTYVAGSDITYTVTLRNLGPNNVSSASFTNTTPANTTFKTWACAASGSGVTACGATNGTTQPIGVPFSLRGNSSDTITYTIVVTVNAGTTADITNTPSVAQPSNTLDTDTTNNNNKTVTDKGNRISNLQLTDCDEQGGSDKYDTIWTWTVPAGGLTPAAGTYTFVLSNGTSTYTLNGASSRSAVTGTYQLPDTAAWSNKTFTLTAYVNGVAQTSTTSNSILVTSSTSGAVNTCEP